MDIVVAAIAVAAFAATVLVLTGALSPARRGSVRTIPAVEMDADDPEWLNVSDVAQMLDVREADIANLVERRAIPFFLIAGKSPADATSYRFRRDEIDAWTIG